MQEVKSPAPLIWPDGRLMRPETLIREISAPTTGSVRSILSGHPAQGLDPARLGGILRSAEQGDAIAYCELAEEMEEKDLHYLSVLSTRKRAVCQLPITVEEAGDSAEEKADAEFLRNWLKRDMLEHELFEILDAIGKGYSACEIVYRKTRETWLPRDIKWRNPAHFEFDRETGERLMLRENTGPTPLPAAKFIVHIHKAKSGLPIRGGLARAVAWAYMFKNYALKDWVIFLESYGHPLRLGKYSPNATEADKRILANALMDLGADAWGTIPETMSVDFIDRKAGTSPGDLWRAKAEYWDSQVSKAVLGQTNTTDAQAGSGIGSGQADVHNEVRHDIERADAKLLSATLNRDVAVPVIMLNRGPRENYPRFVIAREDEQDIVVTVETAEKLAGMGVQIGGDQLRDRAGLSAPEKDEQPLRPQSAQNAQEGQNGAVGPEKPSPHFLSLLKGQKTAVASRPATAAERGPDDIDDNIDLTADEALSDWEALMGPVTAPVLDLIDDVEDLPELRRRLHEAIDDMDVEAFSSMLARGLFGAHLQGDADVQADENE